MSELVENNLKNLNIAGLASMAQADWSKRGKGVNFAAVPYLSAMHSMESIDSTYGYDSGRGTVLYFLANASSWRGDTAKAIKAELRRRLK